MSRFRTPIAALSWGLLLTLLLSPTTHGFAAPPSNPSPQTPTPPRVCCQDEQAKCPQPASRLIAGEWSARWIRDGECSAYDYGVYLFRRNFTLPEAPRQFVINLTADNRYRLFVNGTPVCAGPARGDRHRWFYETVDIAPLLREGGNTLAVAVWNFGEARPEAQLTFETGLLVQGNTPAEEIVNTSSLWKVMRNEAYSPIGHSFCGAYDSVDGKRYPWGWQQPAFDDSQWKSASTTREATPYGHQHYGLYYWSLFPREIPMMEERLERIPSVRHYTGLTKEPRFITGNDPLTIPAASRCTILLDQGHLTNAYPELLVSGGAGSSIRLVYGEAMRDAQGNKGNRDEIRGREIERIHYDLFCPDGEANRLFRPLWLRPYRYLQLEITTADTPLVLNDLYGYFTGYPFRERGSFRSDDSSLDTIWKVGWRTARLCAVETYFDCPFYEQLQYIGDTRIQALISYYVSGDDALARQAIRAFDLSRSSEGITACHYPGTQLQYIPPFSLYWVNMLHDYWLYRNDPAFVRNFLSGMRGVLEWFISHIDPQSGMLSAKLPHWNFVDWVPSWPYGNAPEGEDAGSSILSLSFVKSLRDAAELFLDFGFKDEAARYDSIADRVGRESYRQCWDPSRGLLRDYRGSDTFSQHANIMGILTEVIPAADQRGVFERLDSDTTLAQATFYYRFYLTRALKQVGLADRYSSMLGPWHEMIRMGLSTFAETPEPTRSDCHAWSSSPNYDFLATLCGIEPDAPGFSRVKIAPHFGHLTRLEGVVPHPSGEIRVRLHRSGETIRGEVTLPASLNGRFLWKGKEIALREGVNQIKL